MSNNNIMLAILFLMGLIAVIEINSAFKSTLKLEQIEDKIVIHNDIVSGKATYIPGHACLVRAGKDDAPEDILRFAKACSVAHKRHLEEVSEEAPAPPPSI